MILSKRDFFKVLLEIGQNWFMCCDIHQRIIDRFFLYMEVSSAEERCLNWLLMHVHFSKQIDGR